MQKPRKRKRRKWIIILLLVLIIGGAVGWRRFFKTEELANVQVEKVAKRDVTEIVVASGKIQPVTQVIISPEVAGEIVALPVQQSQAVKKGDLLVQIKRDNYLASKNSASANLKFSEGMNQQAKTELDRAEADYKRFESLFKNKPPLVTETQYLEVKTSYEMASLRLANTAHQIEQARSAMARAEDDLAKTTITSPIDGIVTVLKSQLGERVLGTSFNMGTEMMTVAQLDNMEARVDIGEIDIVLIQIGQTVNLEVDAFKDKKFKGTVTAIANAVRGPGLGMSMGGGGGGGGSQQEAPKFEVRIRIDDKADFRTGMSVTAEIETRSRKEVLTVPIQSVTTRLPAGKTEPPKEAGAPPKKGKPEPIKPIEVVFALEGDHVKMIPVKTGISDNDYFEIIEGVTEGQQIISGGYKAISKDLEDGKKVKVGAPETTPPAK